MSATLVQVLIALTKGVATPTPTGQPSAGTSVVVTDSTGQPQAAVVLTGNESPPWSFTASVAPGTGVVVASDMDANGSVLGTPISQSFTEQGTVGGNNFLPTTAISVTPAAATQNSALRR
jgi:hypothetical protein